MIKELSGRALEVRAPLGAFAVRAMERGDIPEAAALYRSVRIGRGDLPTKLDSSEGDSFARRGGMFLIHDEVSLARLLDSPDDVVWVARGAAGDMRGLFWCGLDDAKYHAEPGPEAAREALRAFRAGKAYFSKEIIAHDAPRLAEGFLLAGMRAFRSLGREWTWGEVYRVNWYDAGAGRRTVNQLNEASYRMLLRTGCERVGEFAPAVLRADGYEACISAQILRWRLAEAIPALEEHLSQKGVTITEGIAV